MPYIAKGKDRKTTSLGILKTTMFRFNLLCKGYKKDAFLNRLMDLWQIMSETERAEYFDRAAEAQEANDG